jgi:trans-2,3-dihydro-3-hydroxyanthranilate isomerase
MTYQFYTCDVFTDTRFGGNPLAVVLNAQGLSTEQMQLIAREFNYSETTFVLPPEKGHTHKVRIFNRTSEMPFAGHPNIGTAFTLATIGALGEQHQITFEEQAGLVAITIRKETDKPIWCELKAPQVLSLGQSVTPERMAAILSLDPSDLVTTTHLPQVASVGLPFVMTELKDRTALERVRVNTLLLAEPEAENIRPSLFTYIRSRDEFDIRARMFAPLAGTFEDPATGSANCALAAMLTHYDTSPDGTFSWHIAQGIEMKRPSILDARTEKQGGAVTGVWIAGSSVMISQGTLEVDLDS